MDARGWVRRSTAKVRERLAGRVRRRHVALAVAALVAIGSVGFAGAYAAASLTHGGGASSASGPAAAPISTKGFPSGAGQPGIFTDRCAYSHEAADDAILAYGLTGKSMHHDFYGNTSTDASSTAKSLVGGQTTCTTSADASAYWTPVLYQHGTALTPQAALIYWRRPAKDSESVATVPAGLQLIAGNEGAMAPQGTNVIAWTCTGTNQAHSETPHDCAAGHDLRVIVTFPSCWDGHTLVGARQVNVVYRTASGCPASHPVQIPQIVFHVAWPTTSASGLTLSMSPTMQGSTNTMHVDFINGWNQSVLNRNVTACLATSTRCGPVTGPQATPQGPAASAGAPKAGRTPKAGKGSKHNSSAVGA